MSVLEGRVVEFGKNLQIRDIEMFPDDIGGVYLIFKNEPTNIYHTPSPSDKIKKIFEFTTPRRIKRVLSVPFGDPERDIIVIHDSVQGEEPTVVVRYSNSLVLWEATYTRNRYMDIFGLNSEGEYVIMHRLEDADGNVATTLIYGMNVNDGTLRTITEINTEESRRMGITRYTYPLGIDSLDNIYYLGGGTIFAYNLDTHVLEQICGNVSSVMRSIYVPVGKNIHPGGLWLYDDKQEQLFLTNLYALSNDCWTESQLSPYDTRLATQPYDTRISKGVFSGDNLWCALSNYKTEHSGTRDFLVIVYDVTGSDTKPAISGGVSFRYR